MIYSAILMSAIAFTACSEDSFVGDQSRDWEGTTNTFITNDEKGFSTYYTPSVGRVGDPMPFYDSKAQEFKVMYLQEFDNNDSYCYHPFWGVSTKDGANYQSLGEILPTGKSSLEQDAALGTGCCVYNEADGLYYIFYTGHNPKSINAEVVMRATSTDFKTWTKDNSWAIYGSDYGYSSSDFRDPQVFNGDDGLYHMIISSKLKFAEFTSSDLKTWNHAGVFSTMIWDRMLECPDIFKMGDYWYMVYSEAYKASWSRKVKYMMAKSLDELKKCFNEGPKWPNDGREGVLDTRAFYAGKTASNGTDRYIWGWCPYRTGSTIYDKNVNVGAGGEPNWSGSLVCHKLIQHSDGTLSCGEVPAIKEKYTKTDELKVMDSKGATMTADGGTLTGDDAYVLYNRLGTHNHISFTVTTQGNTDKFGISLVRGTDSKKYYSMVVNPENESTRKINFEEQGEEGKGFVEGIDGYPFSRPSDNTYKIDIYTDNSVMVMYVNGNVCYTNRIYGIQKNCWSINNYGGNVTISQVNVREY